MDEQQLFTISNQRSLYTHTSSWTVNDLKKQHFDMQEQQLFITHLKTFSVIWNSVRIQNSTMSDAILYSENFQ